PVRLGDSTGTQATCNPLIASCPDQCSVSNVANTGDPEDPNNYPNEQAYKEAILHRAIQYTYGNALQQGPYVPSLSQSAPPPNQSGSPTAAALEGTGMIFQMAGTASDVTSIIWQGEEAKAFVLSSYMSRFGYRALQTTWLFEVTNTTQLMNWAKMTNNEAWVKPLVAQFVWKPVSFAYAFHAGVSGHDVLRLIDQEAAAPLGRIAVDVELPAYR